MPLLDNLKHLFGLGTASGGASPNVAPMPTTTSPPAPNPPTNVAPAPDTSPRPAPSDGLPPTPRLREQLFGFIVNHLTAYTNETEGLPTGLTLWLCTDDPAEQDGLNVALWASQPGQFQRELSRHLADHYIQLAPGWQFQWQFVDGTLPTTCTYRQGRFGLDVHHPALEKPLRARLRALVGQTADEHYVLDPAVQTEYRIGRGKMAETASGRVRTNDVAFLDASEPGFDAGRGDANGSVSRQHATIRYDTEGRRYRLIADAGGLPASGNKTKILRTDDTVERADLPGVGYVLRSGDQIELGGDAKLLFEVET